MSGFRGREAERGRNYPRAPRLPGRPPGPLPFDWDVTALGNQFTDPAAGSWRQELHRIRAPTLLVAGGPASHDQQGQLAEMAALIPDCELVTVPAGHLVHAARPAEFTAAVTAFLGRMNET